MSSYCSTFSFDTLCRAFGQEQSLPLGRIFTPELLTGLACRYQVCFANGPAEIWGVALTGLAWVLQCLCKDKSCLKAASRVVGLCVLLGLAAPSCNTGAYCKARAKLPADFLRDLSLTIGRALEDQAPLRWRWRGRRVLLIDGTTITAPDTPENQKEYPQLSQQEPGLGFPILRMIVVFGLATASLLGCAFGRYEGEDTGETALLRVVLDELQAGDILVADRYYCTWWLLALAQQRGILVCFRLCAARKAEFPHGGQGSPQDYCLNWSKPKCPDWMGQATFDSLPALLTVRIVDYRVPIQGFRPSRVMVATTLLCGKQFPKEDIADLYHKRWHVEVDIRTIKQTMQMEELSCLTPEMLKAEIWTHWLGYNLARLVAAQAAVEHKLQPRQISFSGVRANLESFNAALVSKTAQEWHKAVRDLWRAVATHKVGGRPGRSEPREKKRRPKNKYEPLRQPRRQRRAQLLAQKKEQDEKARQQEQAKAAQTTADSKMESPPQDEAKDAKRKKTCSS